MSKYLKPDSPDKISSEICEQLMSQNYIAELRSEMLNKLKEKDCYRSMISLAMQSIMERALMGAANDLKEIRQRGTEEINKVSELADTLNAELNKIVSETLKTKVASHVKNMVEEMERKRGIKNDIALDSPSKKGLKNLKRTRESNSLDSANSKMKKSPVKTSKVPKKASSAKHQAQNTQASSPKASNDAVVSPKRVRKPNTKYMDAA